MLSWRSRVTLLSVAFFVVVLLLIVAAVELVA